ncbi:MAG: cob(I)yrinic acid a,c-diamide adenosyltransferase [Planctomycetota bacterium]|nr:cob(I)yrinic acid a,c-diamide adenosyltransferase [Planctomycetota bacterium]
MKIYTRGGDDGSTGLYGGDRVSKADPRVDAYGSVDELNAVLGWARAAGPSESVDAILGASQDTCFRLGAWLASAPGKDPGVPRVNDDDVTTLETAIDALEDQLEPLKNFILPGGSEQGARLHVARTICRRAERAIVELTGEDAAAVEGVAIRWVNRLSDLLFVQARFENQRSGSTEVPWKPRGA